MDLTVEVYVSGRINYEIYVLLLYRQIHSGFTEPWLLLVAGKSRKSKSNWYASEAEINYKIKQRSVITKDGESPFLYFDGATMMNYRYPPKPSELVFCRIDPLPVGCEDVDRSDPDRQRTPIEEFVFNPALARKQHYVDSGASARGELSEDGKALDKDLRFSGTSLSDWKDKIVLLQQ